MQLHTMPMHLKPLPIIYSLRFSGSQELSKSEVTGYYQAKKSSPLLIYNGPQDKNDGQTVFWPFFAIAPLDKPLTTHSVMTCAVLVAIDRNSRKHLLLHLTDNVSGESMANGLRGKFSFKNSDLFILPGYYPNTRQTIAHMLDGLTQLDSSLPGKVQYVHFPIKGRDILVSWAGQLYCTDKVLPFEANVTENELHRDIQ